MQSSLKTVAEYIASLPDERRAAVSKLRSVLRKNLPPGFVEVMSYGMIGYVVPHKLYPAGYHADPTQPLPFIALASQKNYIALYHMGISADKPLLKWFTTEYPERSGTKLDMGQSCIRLKKISSIPFDLIGELASRMSVDDWILLYESSINKKTINKK